MMNCFRKYIVGIRGRIITSFILLVILPFVMLAGIIYSAYQNYAKGAYGSYMLEALSAAQKQLDEKSEMLVESSMMYYYNELVNLISSENINEDLRLDIHSKLASVIHTYPDISSVYLECDNQVIYAGVEYQDFMKYVKPYEEELIKEKGRHVWLPVTYLLPKKESGYKFIMGKVLNGENKKNIGRLYLVTNAEKMSSAISEVKKLGGEQYLVDDENYIMYCSDKGKITTQLETSDLTLSKKQEYYIAKINGEKSLIAYYKSYKTNWVLISAIPMSFVLRDLIPITVLMVFVSVIYILFLVFMLILLEKKMFRPIRNLTVQMELFAQGNLNAYVVENAIGELGKMEHHFNKMTVRITDLIKNNEEEVKEKNNFKMQALVAQLNPHFIYNSLNTIKWLAVINKQDNIQKMTDALIKILMNATRSGTDYYTLGDEIELIQNYAVIQKARFMNFDIKYQIAECAMSCQIRRFLIQPVVENAIVHGFARGAKRCGEILIRVGCSEFLEIEVIDNGCGFDVESWRNEKQKEDKNHTNIALKNIEQIITLEYGKEYSIDIVSIQATGTTVKYILPVIKEGDADDKYDYR